MGWGRNDCPWERHVVPSLVHTAEEDVEPCSKEHTKRVCRQHQSRSRCSRWPNHASSMLEASNITAAAITDHAVPNEALFL